MFSLRPPQAEATISRVFLFMAILDLFAVLDWMTHLPNALEQRLWQAIETIEGETKIPCVTSVERFKRFGPLDEATHKRLEIATLEQLDRWTGRILDASTVDAVFEEH